VMSEVGGVGAFWDMGTTLHLRFHKPAAALFLGCHRIA